MQICLLTGRRCPDGEMDITTDFGSVILGSNPGRGTTERSDSCAGRSATARDGVAGVFSRKRPVTTGNKNR